MKSFASFGIGSLGCISIQHTIGAANDGHRRTPAWCKRLLCRQARRRMVAISG
jgi:hypothetical protein